MDVRGERRVYCRYCGQQIAFIAMAKGTTMPVDPEPVHYTPGDGPGRFVTIEGKVVQGRERSNGTAIGYISHFATCKNAETAREDAHRKRRK